jgi:glutamine synthetase type III
MTNFRTEKDRLLSELESEIKRNPDNEILKALSRNLNSYQSVSELNGVLSRIVIDSLDFKFEIGEKLIQFENYFSDFSNSIRSTELRKLAKKLIKENTRITFYGKAWSENEFDWIYFDKLLDLKKIRNKFAFGNNIIEHQNLDNRFGLESGFIDKNTNEGIMGKVK